MLMNIVSIQKEDPSVPMFCSVNQGNSFQVMHWHNIESSLLSLLPQLTVFGKHKLSGEVRSCALQK